MQGFAGFCQRRGIALIPFSLIFLGLAMWTEMEILVPSLPEMKRHFGMDDGAIQQLLSVNFIGFFLGVLIAGPLCDSFGRKRLLLCGGLLYLFSCLGCCLTNDFSVLVIARFFQGLFMTGPCLAQGVLLYEHTAGERQIFWMALANAIVTLGMALSPLIGSWISIHYGYQGNLWLVFLAGLAGLIPVLLWVPESLAPVNRQAFNLRQIGCGYLQVLSDWRYMIIALPICALAAGYWVYIGVSALYLVDYLGIAPEAFAYYQGPIVGCFSVISLISGRLVRWVGLAHCVLLSTVMMGAGLLPLLGANLAHYENPLFTTLMMMLFAGGMAPICSVLFPVALNHLAPDLQGKAQALIQALRLLLASLGTGLLSRFYHGPLVPVLAILMLFLLVSGLALWIARGFFGEETPVEATVVGH